MVQEVIHSSQSCKEASLAIKLDLANAFDRIRNSYIYQVMKNYGFLDTLIWWVKECNIKPWIAPLINGCHAPFFQAQRGISQHFPMPPFLYILVVDTLNRRLNRLRNEGSLLGISIESGV